MRRPLATLGAALLLTLAALMLRPGLEPALARACAHAGATVDQATPGELAKALVCLINHARRDRDKPRLDPNGKLRTAAARHNRAMRRENCWEHKCPGETGLGKRIRRTGYLDGARKWRFAESFGCATTPRKLFEAFLERRFHRRNMLDRRYRDVGAAAIEDTILASGCLGNDIATYTVVFAYRKP